MRLDQIVSKDGGAIGENFRFLLLWLRLRGPKSDQFVDLTLVLAVVTYVIYLLLNLVPCPSLSGRLCSAFWV